MPKDVSVTSAIGRLDISTDGTLALSTVTFQANGHQLAVGGPKHVWLIDPQARTVVQTLNTDGGGAFQLSYSPDGRWLAAAIYRGGQDGQPLNEGEDDPSLFGIKGPVAPARIRLWNLATPGEVHDILSEPEAFTNPIKPTLAFTSDGSMLIYSYIKHDNCVVGVYDTESAKTVRSLVPRVKFPVTVAAQDVHGDVSVWAGGFFWIIKRSPDLAILRQQAVHFEADAFDPEHSLAFEAVDGHDHTGGRIFTRDARIKLYEVPDGRLRATWIIRQHGQTTLWHTLDLSNDGKFLAGSNLEGIYLFSVFDARQVAHLTHESMNAQWGSIDDVSFSPDSSELVGVSGGSIFIWELRAFR